MEIAKKLVPTRIPTQTFEFKFGMQVLGVKPYQDTLPRQKNVFERNKTVDNHIGKFLRTSKIMSTEKFHIQNDFGIEFSFETSISILSSAKFKKIAFFPL